MAELEDEQKYDAVQRPISTAHVSIDKDGKLSLGGIPVKTHIPARSGGVKRIVLSRSSQVVPSGAPVITELPRSNGYTSGDRTLPDIKFTFPAKVIHRRLVLEIPYRELRRASRRFRHKRKMRLRRLRGRR